MSPGHSLPCRSAECEHQAPPPSKTASARGSRLAIRLATSRSPRPRVLTVVKIPDTTCLTPVLVLLVLMALSNLKQIVCHRPSRDLELCRLLKLGGLSISTPTTSLAYWILE